MVELKELCQEFLVPQRDKPKEFNGDIPWCRIEDIEGKYLNGTLSNQYVTDEMVKKMNLKVLPINSVICSCSASIGIQAIVKTRCCTNQTFIGIVPKPELESEYLYYYLKSQAAYLKRIGSGTTIPYISRKKFEQLLIPNLSLVEQRKIIDVLNKVESIINARKEQLRELDDLIKSRFVEMFGDPVRNDKNWERLSCKKLTTKIGSGATPKGGNSSYKEEGIPLIRSMNVYNNRFQMKELAYIDDEQAKKLDNVTVEKDDVLLNITGASVARCCIVPEELISARVNQHVSIIRCKQDKVNPIFVNNMFTNGSYQKLLWSIATSGGATREALTKQQVETLEVIVPPLELQNQFATFVRQIDKLKFKVQKSLDETQLLMDSLMQKYFG